MTFSLSSVYGQWPLLILCSLVPRPSARLHWGSGNQTRFCVVSFLDLQQDCTEGLGTRLDSVYYSWCMVFPGSVVCGLNHESMSECFRALLGIFVGGWVAKVCSEKVKVLLSWMRSVIMTDLFATWSVCTASLTHCTPSLVSSPLPIACSNISFVHGESLGANPLYGS